MTYHLLQLWAREELQKPIEKQTSPLSTFLSRGPTGGQEMVVVNKPWNQIYSYVWPVDAWLNKNKKYKLFSGRKSWRSERGQPRAETELTWIKRVELLFTAGLAAAATLVPGTVSRTGHNTTFCNGTHSSGFRTPARLSSLASILLFLHGMQDWQQ